MVTEQDLRDQLGRAFKPNPVTVLAEVKGVNQSDRTCDIDDDGVMIYGVRLQSITQGNCGITIVPKVGSKALCIQIESTDSFMMLHASEIDKIEINVAGKTLTGDSNGFVFNNGTIGAVKADKLIEWMTKVYTDLELIKATLMGGVTTPAGPGTLTVPYSGGSTNQPQLSEFTDDTLKH